MLQEQLLRLNEKIIYMSGLVEKMIRKCMAGMANRDEDALRSVQNEDETAVNQVEMEIDHICMIITARFHPEAKDLRSVLMILKMNKDLERMGDLAVNIAESAEYIIQRPEVAAAEHLSRLAERTSEMLQSSINCFINEDTALAARVCERDIEVDRLSQALMRETIEIMTLDPQTIERCFHVIRISNALERISDLSTNIAEDTIYIAEGKIVKHQRLASHQMV